MITDPTHATIRSSDIEIIVGLPHLARGPLLARAADLGAPVLISANCLSRWRKAQGWREWSGWRTSTLANAAPLASVDLDSAGFSMTVKYGGMPWTIDDYMALAATFPFRRVAAADYCCEVEVAHDREEVRDRVSRTIATNRECHTRAIDLGIRDRLMPVLQGRTPCDYVRCLDALQGLMLPGTVIGVGSMCRRPIHGPEGLVAVVERLSRELPIGTMLHGFGVKGDALPFLAPFARWVASIDSQAYGIAARRDAHRRRIAKTDQLVADHLERWYRQQCARAARPPRFLPEAEEAVPPSTVRPDPWEHAIAIARQQIRELIETGDLDHDEITAAWIETWAADIYHDHREAA
jgi:hypothetical protein